MSLPTLFPEDEPRAPFPCTARDLVAVLYRQAGLIAICALAPVALHAAFDPGLPLGARHGRGPGQTTPRPKAAERARAGDGLRAPGNRIVALPVQHVLKLDLSPELPLAISDATAIGGVVEASTPPSSLRLDEARELEQVGLAPDSTGAPSRVMVDAADARSKDGIVAWLGPLAGLLAGLLLAALRELGGDRMRSPREAERALGVAVLGAIPTLSAKARSACFEPHPRAQDAAAAQPA